MILQYIRSAVFSFVALPLLTFVTTVFGIPFLFMKRPDFMRLIKFWIYSESVLERVLLGLRYEVRGQEYLPSDGPYIVAAKHQSTYETFKLHELFDDAAIILKKELLSIPLWGWYLGKTGVIPIDRSTPDKAVISIRDGAMKVKDEGRVLVLFPQGTRVRPDIDTKKVSYKSGVYRVHEVTKLPVVPMATNSGCFWPKGSLLKKPGTVVFEFLPPMAQGLERKEFMSSLEDIIETASNQLAVEAHS